MKNNLRILVKYKKGDDIYWGEKKGDFVYRITGNVYGDYEICEMEGLYEELVKVPPCDPTKIVAIALNYKGVAQTSDDDYEPLIFLKGPNALVYDGDPVFCPSDKITWLEVELGLIIKKKCSNITYNEAKDYILGYTLGNDITAANIAGRDHHLARSKSMDSFCPVGPYLVEGIDPSDINLVSRINNEIIQNASTKDLVFDVYKCVSLISQLMTLYPGDLVLTGTPFGTGPGSRGLIKPGDTIEIEAVDIFKLTNKVVSI